MDGVLEGAALLCVCKLACTLFFLPSLAACYSPVSFCCCCLLIFTDFLVTVFLSFLCVFGSWLTQLTPQGDVVALRFLLFLSHTYGAVFLLTTPLIAMDTLIRLLWPHAVTTFRTASRAASSDGQLCYAGEVNVEEEEEDGNSSDKDKDRRSSHVVGYLCCLSVWVIVALNVRWRWRQEEVRAAACLHTTSSLVGCLPNLFSPMPGAVNPCWGTAFLFILLLLLIIGTGLQRRHRTPAQMASTHRGKHEVNNKDDSYWQDCVPALSVPFKSANRGMSEPVQCVDTEKTESSCTVHRTYSWNSVQMSARHHGDFVLTSPECLTGKRGGQEHERTKRGIPLTFITEEHVDSQRSSRCGWRQWGFPCLGVNIMIGFVVVLSIFVLPLILSINVLLIRTIESLLGLCVKYIVSSAENSRATSHNETVV